MRCDTRTFLSGTRRALRVARVSVSHAASHSIFIGVNIQLTSESLVRILRFCKQIEFLSFTMRNVSLGRPFFFLIHPAEGVCKLAEATSCGSCIWMMLCVCFGDWE